MTAGILWLGLRILGVDKPMLYDEVRARNASVSHFSADALVTVV